MCISFFLFGCAKQHVGSLFPDQGSNPRPLHLKGRVLTNGPPRKSQTSFFFLALQYLLSEDIIQSHILKYHLCVDTPKYYFQS